MDGQLGDRRQGRATRSFARRLAPAIALALGLGGVLVHSRTGAGAPQAPAPAAAPAVWVQRSFLVGGWCIGSAAVPENLVALDAAGLDFLTDEDQAPGRRIVGVFAARMDSLRRARPGMRMRALLFLRRQPPQPGDFTANPDPRANRDALAATFREPELAGPGVAGWGLWDEPCDSSSIAHAVDLVRLVRSLPQTRGGIPLINLFPIPPPRGGQCYEGPFHDSGATRPARYAASRRPRCCASTTIRSPATR
jgi:hypothetical protein